MEKLKGRAAIPADSLESTPDLSNLSFRLLAEWTALYPKRIWKFPTDSETWQRSTIARQVNVQTPELILPRRSCRWLHWRPYYRRCVFLFPNEVKRTAIYQRKKFKRRRSKALDFTLYELIKIAEECAWFPSKYVVWGGKRATAKRCSGLRRQQ
jgi:hypothetical protein